jgi:hypothetical protein
VTTPTTPKTAKWKTNLIIVAGAVLIAVCAFAVTRDNDRPGSPDVYSRIEGLTSCSALQGEFNAAAANHQRDIARGRTDLAEIDTSYMKVAEDRMKELGCH